MKKYNELDLLKFMKMYITAKDPLIKSFGSVANLNRMMTLFIKTENFDKFITGHYNFYLSTS